jgi:ketosteroid isomerase-like protein
MHRRASAGTAATPIERMYSAWDDALSRNSAAALLTLYAPDAIFESGRFRAISLA